MTTRRAGGLRRAPKRGLKTKSYHLLPTTFLEQGKTQNQLYLEASATVFQNLNRRNGVALYSHTGRAGGLRKDIN
jgi:hypothetical protein